MRGETVLDQTLGTAKRLSHLSINALCRTYKKWDNCGPWLERASSITKCDKSTASITFNCHILWIKATFDRPRWWPYIKDKPLKLELTERREGLRLKVDMNGFINKSLGMATTDNSTIHHQDTMIITKDMAWYCHMFFFHRENDARKRFPLSHNIKSWDPMKIMVNSLHTYDYVMMHTWWSCGNIITLSIILWLNINLYKSPTLPRMFSIFETP